MPHVVEEAVNHFLVEFGQLFLFLLAAMTYVNAMSDRNVFEALRGWLVGRGYSYRAMFWITGILIKIAAMYEFIRSVPQFLEASNCGVSFDELIKQTAATGLGDKFNELRTSLAISDDDYRRSMETLRPALQKTYADCFRDHRIDALIFPATWQYHSWRSP